VGLDHEGQTGGKRVKGVTLYFFGNAVFFVPKKAVSSSEQNWKNKWLCVCVYCSVRGKVCLCVCAHVLAVFSVSLSWQEGFRFCCGALLQRHTHTYTRDRRERKIHTFQETINALVFCVFALCSRYCVFQTIENERSHTPGTKEKRPLIGRFIPRALRGKNTIDIITLSAFPTRTHTKSIQLHFSLRRYSPACSLGISHRLAQCTQRPASRQRSPRYY